MKPLSGRTVLFIGIGFYDYEKAIADELRALGAEVVYFEALPALKTRGPGAPLLRRMGVTLEGLVRRHQQQIIAAARAMPRLDDVFVIKGEHLDESFLAALRAAQPEARWIAYHWDSMARFPDLIRRQALFDRVFTFDHADAAAHGEFRLRPLFFRPEVAALALQAGAYAPAPATGRRTKLSFVGWLHHERLAQVERVAAWAERQGMDVDFYLSTGRFSTWRHRLKGNGRFVHARPMAYARYIEMLSASDIVIDLPHPQQTGLTMRAIEALGAGKKLVTTSRDIARYDFYRPENVLIVDPDTLAIDARFVRQDKATVSPDLVTRYSLRAWVEEIFDVQPQAPRNSFVAQ